MPDINYLAVAVAAIACFVISAAYYIGFGKQLAALHPAYAGEASMAPWQIGVELVRNIVLALVVAGIAAAIGITNVGSGVLLALALFVGFPLVLWSGAVMHEKVPPKLAAIHAGDWLLKLLVIAVIVSLWR
ncbi:MAG: DUF1761 domain-containing protein [Micromonosporaceae bacterium]